MATPASHCPAAKAANLLGDKWTLLILRAMMMGATRYSEFTAAIPRISPSVLSGRLKQLCEDGLVVRRGGSGQAASYRLSPSGRETGPILALMAQWGVRWAERHTRIEQVDVGGAMWDMHKSLETRELPDGETVLAFTLTDIAEHQRWWMVADGAMVDLCNEDPGKDVDLYIRTGLETLIDIWKGDLPLAEAIADECLMLTGEAHLLRSADLWFPYAPPVKQARAGIDPTALPAAGA